MKQFLILLSSIATLTISSNTFANFNQNTTFINDLQKNSNNDNQTLLFNNKYGYLSDSDWITNQSITDHKFYSYDSKHADYELSNGINARSVFFVDVYGELQYDSNLFLEKDKADIENTKQQMIYNKKITIIKNDYNPYSKSEYSNTYFSCDNNDWQYIQFGGIEKHIDISQQVGGNKVENSNNLSETLGLYYIAQAVKENKISKAIADNLYKYFIKQSALKAQFNSKLITKIIELIINNNKIYKLFFYYNEKDKKVETIFNNDDKNYSLNFVFDNDNNLITIYYNQFNNNDINNNINSYYKNIFNGTASTDNPKSDPTILLQWKNYTNTWQEFVTLYSKMSFDNSFIKINNPAGAQFINDLTLNTNQINTNIPNWFDQNNHLLNNTFSFHVSLIYFQFLASSIMELNLCIWHDNANIYWQWALHTESALCSESAFCEISLKSSIFYNIMK